MCVKNKMTYNEDLCLGGGGGRSVFGTIFTA